LDEWADGSGNNLDFSMGIYQKVYLTALKFLNKATEDPKHKDYMQNLREKWFKAGRSLIISLIIIKLDSFSHRERLGLDVGDGPDDDDEMNEDWLASEEEI
jgi:hypothetical protein